MPGFAGRGINPGCPQWCADVLLQSFGVLASHALTLAPLDFELNVVACTLDL